MENCDKCHVFGILSGDGHHSPEYEVRSQSPFRYSTLREYSDLCLVPPPRKVTRLASGRLKLGFSLAT